jgi:ABC-2 type transport system permease protein
MTQPEAPTGSSESPGTIPRERPVGPGRGWRHIPVAESAGEARPAERPREPVLRPAGWRVVARKELADHLRSARFGLLAVLVGLTAAATVYAAAGGIRDDAPELAGQPALFLGLFTTAPERLFAFFGLIGFLAPLLGIAFGFDAVNGERARGTLPRLLAQPIHRDDVVNGKFAAGLAVISVFLAALALIVSGIGLLRLGIVPTAAEVARVLAFLVVTILYVGVWLAFAMLCSVVFRRAATTALTAIAVWLVLTLFGALIVDLVAEAVAPARDAVTVEEVVRSAELRQNLARVSPAVLYQEATVAVLNPNVRAIGFLLPTQVDRAVPSALPLDQSLLLVWPQVVALVGLLVVLFAAAYIGFLRQEVRA